MLFGLCAYTSHATTNINVRGGRSGSALSSSVNSKIKRNSKKIKKIDKQYAREGDVYAKFGGV